MLVSTNAPNEPSTCRRPTGQQLTTPDTVKARLTPKRPRRQVENDDYAVFIRRILRAYSRRAGDSDIEALVLMCPHARSGRGDRHRYLSYRSRAGRCTSGSRAGSGVLIPIRKLSPRKGNRTLPI